MDFLAEVLQPRKPLLPTYVTRDLARAIINVAETTLHLLLLETLWQSYGRVTEVLRLRLSDAVEAEGALRLNKLKQRRRGQQHKVVYVSPKLLSQLRAFATDARLGLDRVLLPLTPEQHNASEMVDDTCNPLIRT